MQFFSSTRMSYSFYSGQSSRCMNKLNPWLSVVRNALHSPGCRRDDSVLCTSKAGIIGRQFFKKNKKWIVRCSRRRVDVSREFLILKTLQTTDEHARNMVLTSWAFAARVGAGAQVVRRNIPQLGRSHVSGDILRPTPIRFLSHAWYKDTHEITANKNIVYMYQQWAKNPDIKIQVWVKFVPGFVELFGLLGFMNWLYWCD